MWAKNNRTWIYVKTQRCQIMLTLPVLAIQEKFESPFGELVKLGEGVHCTITPVITEYI